MTEVRRMSAREGRAFINGEEVTSLIKLNAVFVPEVTKKRIAGQRGMTSKVLGYDITGTITTFKATPWVTNAIKNYLTTGIFPKMDIVAFMSDPDSDYVSNYGEQMITFEGVQLEGEIPMIGLDVEGEEVMEEVTFSARNVVFG